MKYLLVLVSSVLAMIVGVYIGELRMQVQELEDSAVQDHTTIVDTTHTTVLNHKLIDLLK